LVLIFSTDDLQVPRRDPEPPAQRLAVIGAQDGPTVNQAGDGRLGALLAAAGEADALANL
jgi:hypothetical protein